MRDVSYWEAWSLWFNGQPTENLRMWGQPMLVWGRVGKSLQVIGALTVIIDIIGPVRIQRFGESLSAQDTRVRHGLDNLRELRTRARGWPYVAAGVIFLGVFIASFGYNIVFYAKSIESILNWEWPSPSYPIIEFWPWWSDPGGSVRCL